jgi:hypothetical protein
MGECTICLEALSNPAISLKKCGHNFHEDCMQRLRDSNNNMCPTCRTKVSSGDVEPTDLDVEPEKPVSKKPKTAEELIEMLKKTPTIFDMYREGSSPITNAYRNTDLDAKERKRFEELGIIGFENENSVDEF